MLKSNIYLPLVIAVTLAAGIFLGTRLASPATPFANDSGRQKSSKIAEILTYIEHEYVDTINIPELEEKAIQTLLQELDPHSFYIPASDLEAMNEPLEGNFDGIGIEFRIRKDTLTVINTISGGPSAKVGILPGDRIITVEGEEVAGIGITNKQVVDKLRGARGTKVKLEVKRNNSKKLIEFEIERDQIPIFSVDVAYMLNADLGYIKVSRFAKTTFEEFVEAAEKLKSIGMKKMVIDLRGNGGGYMDAAVKIADELLPKGSLIVYTKGKSRKRKEYFAERRGRYEDMPITILVDESSASASEIVAGAIQDNDRGTIIGRRSFGKGLVQEPSAWPDGSSLRLTIARYYTPTGRCIQKPYTDGVKKYYKDYYERLEKGEHLSSDSIDFPDSLKFVTPKGKVVYGGGGIMPDVFVPYDTAGRSYYFSELMYKGVFAQFSFNYADKHRKELTAYLNTSELIANFEITPDVYDSFLAFAKEKGVNEDAYGKKVSESIIKLRLKASILNHIKDNEAFYPVIHTMDSVVARTVRLNGLTGS